MIGDGRRPGKASAPKPDLVIVRLDRTIQYSRGLGR